MKRTAIPEAVDYSGEGIYNTSVLTTVVEGKGRVESRYRGRRLMYRSLLAVLVLQLIAFALAGGVLYLVADLDLLREFYSAHRSLESLQQLIIPAILISAGVGFILTAFFTWLGFRAYGRRLIGPIRRADEMLQRLSVGDLAFTPAVVPPRERWSFDDSAETMLDAYRERMKELQRITKDVHNAVLALRYKATGSDALTLQELREATSALDLQCKKLTASIKWFET